MRIAIGLAGAVMAVILAKRRQFFQPLVDVGEQSVLRVVDPHTGRDMHGGYQNHALLNAGLAQGRLHLRGNVKIFPVLWGLKREIFRIEPHSLDITILET